MNLCKVLKTVGKVTAATVVALAVRRALRRNNKEQNFEVEVEAVGHQGVETEVGVDVEDLVVDERQCAERCCDRTEGHESDTETNTVDENECGERGEQLTEAVEQNDGMVDSVVDSSDEVNIEERETVYVDQADGMLSMDHGIVAPPILFNDDNYYRIDYGCVIPVEGHLTSFVDRWNPTVFYGGPIIGEGGFGSVALSQDEYGYVCALKTVEYRDEYQAASMSPLVKREMELQPRCAGDSVVGAYGFWETEYDANLAFEFMALGNVEDKVFRGSDVEGQAISEERAATVIRKMAVALETCHRRGVVHCDLKLANILVGGNGEVKLSDFGLAVEMQDDGKTDVRSFEPQLAAPELRGLGRYGSAVDMWALGLVMYELLTGTRRWHLAICASRREHVPGANEMSEDAKDLLLGLLSEDERVRPSARDVLSHRWVMRCGR